jgi:HlyD family secretion protein
MSVSATIETRTRTNIISAPIAAVTARNLSAKKKGTNSVAGGTNGIAEVETNSPGTNAVSADEKKSDDKKESRNKPVECVFVADGDKVKAVRVKLGVSDDNYYEVTEGLKEGDEIVTGNLNAISRTLEDGKKITKTVVGKDTKEEKMK